ncbi:MAG: hemagglutinin repeat-containing protein, partial [Alphaproteobacteria bacterium]|nr:hemagglutinin repeat-containing protein [Alphaproteobacteria bacterium]
GSTINADQMLLNAKTLTLKASKNTTETNSNSDTKTVTASASTSGSASVGASTSSSNSKGTTTTHNNTQLNGNKITTVTTGDTTLEGANLNGSEIDMSVGGDLTVTSLQDETSKESKSQGGSVGYGSGGASGGVNGGFSYETSKWTNNQTSIKGTKSVKVNVAGKTTLTGALIGNIDEDGNDLGNLDFKTASLITKDLTDTSKGKKIGGGISGSSGSTTVTANYSGHDKEQKTNATIGKGKLTVADGSGSDVNRDTDKAQVVTKDKKLGGLDVDMKVDHNLLTKEGHKKIKDDLVTASAITNAIEQIVTTDKAGITDFFDETEKNVKVYEGMKKELAKNKELAKQLQNPNLTPKKKQEMLQTLASTVATSLGYKTNEVKVVSTDTAGANGKPIKGHYGENDKTYVNDKYNDSTSDLITTLGHETQHSMDEQAGTFKPNDEDQNEYATNFGKDVAFYTDGALGYTTGGSLATTNSHNSGQPTSTPSVFNDNTFANNNLEFDGVDKSKGDDFKAYLIDHGSRNGKTYGGIMYVVGDNGKSTVVNISTWPNRESYYTKKGRTDIPPGIAETMDGKSLTGQYLPKGHNKGREPGIIINNNKKIDTIGPNPAQNGTSKADYIHIHKGYSDTCRGSANCPTIKPSQAPNVWDVLEPGEKGTVVIKRRNGNEN